VLRSGPAGLFGAGGDEFTIRNEVRLVLLDVSVQNRDGNFVPGLSKPDFTVLKDGRQQAISVFDNEDAPVTTGILIDESGSMTQKRGQVLAAAQDLIAESNRQDDVFVLNFNDSVKRGFPEAFCSAIRLRNCARLFIASFPRVRRPCTTPWRTV